MSRNAAVFREPSRPRSSLPRRPPCSANQPPVLRGERRRAAGSPDQPPVLPGSRREAKRRRPGDSTTPATPATPAAARRRASPCRRPAPGSTSRVAKPLADRAGVADVREVGDHRDRRSAARPHSAIATAAAVAPRNAAGIRARANSASASSAGPCSSQPVRSSVGDHALADAEPQDGEEGRGDQRGDARQCEDRQHAVHGRRAASLSRLGGQLGFRPQRLCYIRRPGVGLRSCVPSAGSAPACRWIARAHSAALGIEPCRARGPERPVFLALTHLGTPLNHAS